eukprot:CAMPEP_0113471084 /NCGR_PEP_ID=MMETSP0014_2-20120614/16794_1 /TAXON_ID=2857 /ORGANISM="Nitzschia sp." /LENGTH=498 /DNA_ID=CAMNT_0000363705 /DNA_START=96 /DNA_END=1592 /DNA_ORIENTATION=- /assembly_acc=CAM_ASM_000159
MADYAKRPEITISTMGKVHNPTGEGVRAVSSQVQSKAQKHAEKISAAGGEGGGGDDDNNKKPVATVTTNMPLKNGGTAATLATAATTTTTAPAIASAVDSHETKTKEGTAKRNIVRKKTDPRETGNYDSRNKKQGGHGKAQWKNETDPMMALHDQDHVDPIDVNDPLYDETEDAKFVLTSQNHVNGEAALHPTVAGNSDNLQMAAKVYGPMLTQSEFKIQVSEALREYFDSSDTDEVIRSIEELQCREYHPDVVKRAVSVSLDKSPRERELISRLLTCLHPTPLSDGDMGVGFEHLLDSLDDLTTDVPEAPTMVASFLARAVIDEVLPPAFLSEQNNKRADDIVIAKAIALLNREHSASRLAVIWGPGDGRPVEELKVEIDQLLEEYLLSRELDECARCVKELNSAHYMHELVKRGVKIAMEADGRDSSTQHEKSAIDAMAALFAFLVKNAIISEHQVAKGVDRLHRNLDDLKLDIPAAPKLLSDFEDLLKEEGLAAK